MSDKFLIFTTHGLCGKDEYFITARETIDESKCFNSRKEADAWSDEWIDSYHRIVNVADLSKNGTFNCPHCERDFEHQHVLDKKGYVHTTILRHKKPRKQGRKFVADHEQEKV